MEFTLYNTNPADWKAELIIVLACKNATTLNSLSQLKEAAPWVDITPALRDFGAKAEEIAVAYGHPEQNISRLICVGMGEAEKLTKDPSTFEVLRKSVGTAVKKARALKCQTIGFDLENLEHIATLHSASLEQIIEECTVACKLALHKNNAYMSKPNESKPNEEEETTIRSVQYFSGAKNISDKMQAAMRRGEASADGVLFSRDLANGPANIITPSYLADCAQSMAKKYNFKVEVLGKKEVEELGMGAFLAVARGAKEELRFITIEHCPAGAENQAPLVYVGKGITFDTGGISLKPSAKMHEMKADMGGAAAVLGFFKALGELTLGSTNDPIAKRRVVGVIPSCENMPGGEATRPGDVVTTFNGKTVEILNTDAEGRLILCDALPYAQKRWNPELMVDLATLTGACAIALGEDVAGLFCSDQVLSAEMCKYGNETGDLLWALPLWDRYFESMKSDVADMANIGSREGGASNAAIFLKQFVDFACKNNNFAWAHIDMAGPGFVMKKSSILPGGAAGFGVRILLSLAANK